MPNKVLNLTLFLVTVRGADVSRPLLESQRPSSDIGDSLKSPWGGIPLYLRQEESETVVALDVPADATVRDLVTTAAAVGIDLMSKTLRCRGELLSVYSAPLSEIGVCAETVIDVSPGVWNREKLNELEPIFEGEVALPNGENEIIFLEWDGFRSEKCLRSWDIFDTEPKDCIFEMALVFQNTHKEWTGDEFQWSEEQRAVVDNLQQYHALKDHLDDTTFYVDLIRHVTKTDSKSDITLRLPLQCALQGFYDEVDYGYESRVEEGEFSVEFKRVVSIVRI